MWKKVHRCERRCNAGGQASGPTRLAIGSWFRHLLDAWFWANHSVMFDTWSPHLNYGDKTTYHKELWGGTNGFKTWYLVHGNDCSLLFQPFVRKGGILITLQIMTQLMLTTTPRGRDYYDSHFTDETIKKLRTRQGHAERASVRTLQSASRAHVLSYHLLLLTGRWRRC